MNCKGHTHTTIDGEDKVKLCDEEMKLAGFNKDKNTSLYICKNRECTNYNDNQEVQTT